MARQTFKYRIIEFDTEDNRVKETLLNKEGEGGWEIMSYNKKWKLFGPSKFEVLLKKVN